MTAAEWTNLQAFRMLNQHRLLGIECNDFVKNDTIAQTTRLENIMMSE